MGLPARERRALAVQRGVSRLLAPIWVPLVWAGLRLVGGYRLTNAGELRRTYRRIRAEVPGALLVCPNHLTLVDSVLVTWALGSPAAWCWRFRELPWNVPEARNFAATRPARLLAWLVKCVPVARGGARRSVARVLERLAFLLGRGESVLLFPEGGRSRSGRVDTGARTYGAGRLLGAAPDTKVLCVYLRGEGQRSYTDWPRRGERFYGRIALFEPKSEARGLRRSVDLTRQILVQLAELEREVIGAGETGA